MNLESVLRQFHELQNGGLWFYINFEERLGQLAEEEAFTRPLPSMNSAAEILGHLTHWRLKTLSVLLRDMSVIETPYHEDWPRLPELRALGWNTLQQEYNQALFQITSFLQDQWDDFLEDTYFDPDYETEKTYEFLLEGVLHHDIYHLGQLGIVIKLLNESRG